jgi:hypothetical protein
MTDALVLEIEEFLRRRAGELTAPREGECLLCFVARALTDFGCDNTLRWAGRYRNLRAPRATALEERLSTVGGFCDCEVFLNGYQMRDELCRWDGGEIVGWPRPLPTCRCARRGSTQPCGVWLRQRRGRGY